MGSGIERQTARKTERQTDTETDNLIMEQTVKNGLILGSARGENKPPPPPSPTANCVCAHDSY